jgi:hypothetical protein
MIEMATNLQVDQVLSATAQSVKDEEGNTSPLSLSTDRVGIGTASPTTAFALNAGAGGRDVGITQNQKGGKSTMELTTADSSGNQATRLLIRGRSDNADVEFFRGPRGSEERTLFIEGRNGNIVVSGNLTLQSSNGNTTFQLNGNHGTLTFGGAGADGDLTINNKDGTQTLHINGDTGELTLSRSGNGEKTIQLNGNHGTLTLGGGGADGDITINNRNGTQTIHMVGDSGDINLLGADCAEEFEVSRIEMIEPGTVMIIGDDEKLSYCTEAYDKKVAGVLSGAGGYKPGIVLDKQQSKNGRMPLALTGKVYCKADAQYSPIGVGDLLTTSPTLGHAMKADDPLKAFGAVIGKALRPLTEGQGLIPILITLH